MAESEPRPERVPSAETGRMSHRRRARKRRATESAGALSDGSLEQRIARWMTIIIALGVFIGQFVLTRILMPGDMLRVTLTVIGVIVLTAVVVWFDRLRSKKRNPKPRWLRGILIAGFLSISVVLGSLLVLTMTANPLEDGSFSSVDAPMGSFSTQTHLDSKMMQLKVLIFHIIATVTSMAMLANAAGPERHRRNDSGRFKSSSGSVPKVSG